MQGDQKKIKKGLSNKDSSFKYGLSKNTISTWVRNKEKYLQDLKILLVYF